jgi:hypothetical protein
MDHQTMCHLDWVGTIIHQINLEKKGESILVKNFDVWIKITKECKDSWIE